MRARDGWASSRLAVGRLETGPGNRISDVPGVTVGHVTLHWEDNHTGVTVVVPGEDNPFVRKYTAAAYVHNGFGKSTGLMQVEELGVLETPIALTNTLNVGLVWEGLAEYMVERCRKEGVDLTTLNPVVGECNDSRISRIVNRIIRPQDVSQAIENRRADFSQGAVGAGAGTVCYGFKGGIGSSSRIVPVEDQTYTVGVLVQSNFGAMEDFLFDGQPLGRVAAERLGKGSIEPDKGSIMTVLATDLPLDSRQLYRVIRRCGVGIARTGSYTGHGSGEVMLGFTTANRVPLESGAVRTQQVLREELLNPAFQAAAEATQEAIYQSMLHARGAYGLKGEYYPGIREILTDDWD